MVNITSTKIAPQGFVLYAAGNGVPSGAALAVFFIGKYGNPNPAYRTAMHIYSRYLFELNGLKLHLLRFYGLFYELKP